MRIIDLFNQSAQTYDQNRRLLIPCFDDFYGTALQLLPEHDRPLRVLDIGAGTGLLSSMIAKLRPNAQLVLVDLADQMLAKAAERMAADLTRITIVRRNMLDIADLGQFDLVVSSLAIHHLTHVAKQQLYQTIFHSLLPGGRFINADQVLGPTVAIEARYEAIWQAGARANGVSEAELAASIERCKQDINATLDLNLAWLEMAGFQEVNCWYQWYRFAVFSGDKPTA